MHNTFTVLSRKHGEYKVISHNFPEVGEAVGEDKEAALRTLDNKIRYLMDNRPLEFSDNVDKRRKQGLECGCGKKRKEKPMGVYRGK